MTTHLQSCPSCGVPVLGIGDVRVCTFCGHELIPDDAPPPTEIDASTDDAAEMFILCPYCMSRIDEDTVICPICDEDTTNDAAFELTPTQYAAEPKRTCPHCQVVMFALAVRCPICHRPVGKAKPKKVEPPIIAWESASAKSSGVVEHTIRVPGDESGPAIKIVTGPQEAVNRQIAVDNLIVHLQESAPEIDPPRSVRNGLLIFLCALIVGPWLVGFMVNGFSVPALIMLCISVGLVGFVTRFIVTRNRVVQARMEELEQMLRTRPQDIVWVYQSRVHIKNTSTYIYSVNIGTVSGQDWSIRTDGAKWNKIYEWAIACAPQASQGWHRDLFYKFKENPRELERERYQVDDYDVGFRGFLLPYYLRQLLRRRWVRGVLGLAVGLLIFRRELLWFSFRWPILKSIVWFLNSREFFIGFVFIGGMAALYLALFSWIGKGKQPLEAYRAPLEKAPNSAMRQSLVMPSFGARKPVRPMVRSKGETVKKRSGGRVVVALVVFAVLAFVGWDFYHVIRSRQYAERGIVAYQNGDCSTAYPLLRNARFQEYKTNTDIANFMRIRYRFQEDACKEFLNAVDIQQEGQLAEALIAYDEFIQEMEDPGYRSGYSKDAAAILLNLVRQEVAVIFDQSDPAELFNETTCLDLDGLLERNMIVDPDANLPKIYDACGTILNNAARYGEAAAFYQQLLDEYPAHESAAGTRKTLAQTLIAEAEQFGAGTIGQPQTIGRSGTDKAVVVIQNDSPNEVSLVFTGFETRFEELEACGTCQKYATGDLTACPSEGPVGRYELQPGTYDIVVKPVGGDSVTPFTGRWVLRTGEEYYTCFVLISNAPASPLSGADEGYAQDLYEQGMDKLAAGETTAALVDFLLAVQEDPDFALAHYGLGLVHNSSGLWEDALGRFTNAIELAPTFADAYYQRGLVYNELGTDSEQAIRDLEIYLLLAPNAPNRERAENLIADLKSQ